MAVFILYICWETKQPALEEKKKLVAAVQKYFD